MSESALPFVKLRPLPKARRWAAPFPWLYSDQIAWDRRAKALEAGSICHLVDEEGQKRAVISVNPKSKISGRILDFDPLAVIDQNWFERGLRRALGLRERLYDGPFYRLIHAEGDGLPGVVVDRFDDLFVVQPNAAWIEVAWPAFQAALEAVFGPIAIYKNASGRTRKLEGLEGMSQMVLGVAPEGPQPVPMNGATYMADIIGGQKTGLFYDQRDNHHFAARLIKGGESVLDVFSHVGGFSLAMCAAGAQEALAVDGAQAVLDLAHQGAAAMGVQTRFHTRLGDAFAVMTQLREEGAQFDVVICDPPAFAPNKDALKAGLRAYEKTARMAAHLVKRGGFLGLCSCSHAAQLELFRAASVSGIERAGREGRLIHTGFAGADHPQHPYLAQTSYLKALFFAL